MLPFLYDVLIPMLHPVPARAGDRIVVRPGHPERPVVVVRLLSGQWEPVVIGPPNFGALLGLECDDVIRLRHGPLSSLSQHPAVRSA